ncbi:hypothetical protein Vretimale_608 [Volvox reticuliferus]|uniref:Uncharacterized protein n=1 Tax=Volvox reticuliferus TaxID=1737510 RepID=A0A8J4D811_9CHLO|nr:hypothetical protein Vretifemale_2349 [Volvox reticuliferus]GIL94422.1 hypothetical protein Vretimale_608 [Volvox reticuliferus]
MILSRANTAVFGICAGLRQHSGSKIGSSSSSCTLQLQPQPLRGVSPKVRLPEAVVLYPDKVVTLQRNSMGCTRLRFDFGAGNTPTCSIVVAASVLTFPPNFGGLSLLRAI